MSRSMAKRIFADAFAKWPKQDLRPDYQFQDAVGQAVEKRFQSYRPSMEMDEVLKARALQYIVQDRWMKRYKLTDRMLKPKSQPTYFNDVVREIEEAPRRTWWERIGKRLGGMIRLE